MLRHMTTAQSIGEGNRPLRAISSPAVRELLNQGLGVSAVAKTTGLKRQSVYRIQAEPEKQMAALRAWYPIEDQSRVIDTTLPNSVENT